MGEPDIRTQSMIAAEPDCHSSTLDVGSGYTSPVTIPCSGTKFEKERHIVAHVPFRVLLWEVSARGTMRIKSLLDDDGTDGLGL